MEPILIGSVDISRAGKNCKVLLGDINGDGRMELVCVQAGGGIDARYVPYQVVCVTAFSLTGEELWQAGVPSEEPGGFGADFPAQIFDIDGDGRLEVLAVMDKMFKLLDGATGAVKRAWPLPDDSAHDCIVIANLTGNPTPRDVILKNRYHDMWAMDGDFNLLWKHSGNIGHFPLAYDINGDGRDEVMAGYDMLSPEGEILWSCRDLEDHADCLWAGDVNGDGRPEICVGGSVTCLYDGDGNELWRYDGSVESQHVALGKFLPDAPGLQVAGLDRIVRGDGYKGQWNGKDGMFLLGCDGQEIWKEERKTPGWLTIVNTFSNWAGEGKDHILAYRRGGGVKPALYSGRVSGGEVEAVLTFPEDGYVISGDLFGRGCEEAVIYAEGRAWIYSGIPYDLGQAPSGRAVLQTGKLYRSTLYPGCVYEGRRKDK